jgi:hypothetical protein
MLIVVRQSAFFFTLRRRITMDKNPKAYSPEYLDEMINWDEQCTNNPNTCSNKYFCICENVEVSKEVK